MERDRTFPPPVVHFSELKRMALSPAHFRAAYTDPKAPSTRMQFGTLVHSCVLGGGDFAIFDGERKGNAWKDAKLLAGGRMIVTTAELDRANLIADKVRSNRVVQESRALVGQHEKPLRWRWFGRDCGGTLDVFGDVSIADLKTDTIAEPWIFTSKALRMLYHAQLAWYRIGARENGCPVHSARLVTVEIDPPYEVVVFNLSERALEDGERRIHFWMERLMRAEGAISGGDWSGYTDQEVILDLPAEFTGFDEDESEEELVDGDATDGEAA